MNYMYYLISLYKKLVFGKTAKMKDKKTAKMKENYRLLFIYSILLNRFRIRLVHA